MDFFAPIKNGKHATLPLTKGDVRFAVGLPDSTSSNSWKFFVRGSDCYLTCRDNFQDAKLSLHKSGRWRFGLTEAAAGKAGLLVLGGANRAWEVWQRPTPILPGTTLAFRLLFPCSEIAVRPDQRQSKLWKDVIFIEPAPSPRIVVVSLFVTAPEVSLKCDAGPGGTIASLLMSNGEQAQLVAHWQADENWSQFIESSVIAARRQAHAAGVKLPAGSVVYLFGNNADQARFVLCALLDRP